MLRKVKRIVGIVLLVLFLFTFIYISVVRVTDKTPSLFGFSVIRVSTDDMEPEIDFGEVVIVKNVEPETLQLGDVITYIAEKGSMKGELVTHQISKEPYEENGVYYFTTRGINENAVDDPEIDEFQIRGKVLFLIPYVGTIYDFFTEWYGILALVVIFIIIFGDEIINLIRRLTKKEEFDEDFEHTNIEDIRQSEHVEVAREKEFEGIITDLDDHEE